MATERLVWRRLAQHASTAAVAIPTGNNPIGAANGATIPAGNLARNTGHARHLSILAINSAAFLVTFSVYHGYHTPDGTIWALDTSLGAAGIISMLAADTGTRWDSKIEAPGDEIFIRPIAFGGASTLTVDVMAANLEL